MATGYTWKFPFLEEGVLVRDEDRFDLYKCVFPIHLKHPTLAIFGFFLPFGPGFPPGELQCRWVAQVFAGKCKLPSKKIMLEHTKRRYEANVARYGPSEKVSIKVDYIQYCDELAAEFGAKPNLLKYFFTDIRLFLKIMFGPSLAYQYRLQGPHPWEGAREAIMTSEERMLFPLARRESNVHENVLKRLFRKALSAIVF
ncbi:Dimethylaniline monooxygenase [N-oxide-forming] 2 [Araneus ventricosus]|uniref:Flavin-containing monooxygenase n=1 Tax=Araneus ventricosus TaxID=182803 RepID=A0A4Y2W8C5_ARAVE|nr:Dimethylaniline monooxygenase [N-oxide-forming] 2 [Araneus ventricosus]